jgi:hypothetical protein
VKIQTTEAFERALRALSEPELDIVASALKKLPGAFGRPHAHAGLRKLRGQVYELRAGLDHASYSEKSATASSSFCSATTTRSAVS